MKVISKFKVTKGYGVWKKEFESNEAMRLKRNLRKVNLVLFDNPKPKIKRTIIQIKKLKDVRR